MIKALEPGFYWMRHTVAVIDNDTFADERWIDQPVVARFDGRDWHPFEANALADQFEVEVLSERLVPPAVRTATRRQAERIVEAIADVLYVDDDRMELVARVDEVLMSEPKEKG